MNAAIQAERLYDPTEIRFGGRIPLAVPVELTSGDTRRAAGTLRDLSISGALIETDLELPVFTNLVVTLPTLAGESMPRQLVACVVRQAPAGVGVEWRDMACPTLMNLLRDAGFETVEVAPCDRAFR